MQNATVVYYEDLARTPAETLKTLCDDLDLSFEAQMLTYDSSENDGWALGDQTRIKRERRPVAKSIEKWKRLASESPQAWQVLTDYLHCLGPQTVEEMGCDYEACDRALRKRAPSATRGLFSLRWLLQKPYDDRHLVERAAVRLQDAFLSGGIREAGRMLVRKLSQYAK